jgi:IclR family transcriptional regulator, acetate operon repressor
MQNVARKPPEYPIASVDNALTLLTLLGERKQVRVTEAARMLGTARSTAHRLLAMLEYHGFARQDFETKGYTAGPALIEVGLAAVERLDLRGLARPYLERLSDELGETAHLVRLDDASVVFLDSVESSRALRIGSRVGRSMPAHCTAAGKAILAQLTREELRRLYPRTKLEQMTSRSPKTRAELEAALAEIRERGYATNFGESEDEVAAVAVAIPRRPGMPRASITLSAPITRLDDEGVVRIAEATRKAAEKLGRGPSEE